MKIVLLGEPMGLFMANETGAISEVKTFTASIAGAEYNVAVGLARLGHTPAYCTRLGFDPMGEKILNGLRQNGISTDLVMQAEGELTGLMMKSSTQKGDPDIAYYRKGSAASKISPHDIDGLDLYGCERLHVTGIFPAVSESAFSATRRLISRAQALGIPYSFDPNLRPSLWKSLDAAREEMLWGCSVCQVLKVAEEELSFLTTEEDLEAGAAKLRRDFPSIRLLLVTKGKEGSTAFWREHQVSRPGFPVEAIDTTGAGDTFCGCCLHHILEWGLENLDEARLGEMLSFAYAAAGLVTTRKGALRSMPEEAEVRRLLANR